MMILQNENARITGYLSHPIRGPKGAEATDQDMLDNCRLARKFAADVTAAFPDLLDLYVPAAHDEFVCRAYRMGIISEDEILAVDCEIVASRTFLFIFNPFNEMSTGMKKELDKALELGIPVFAAQYWDKATMVNFSGFIRELNHPAQSRGVQQPEAE